MDIFFSMGLVDLIVLTLQSLLVTDVSVCWVCFRMINVFLHANQDISFLTVCVQFAMLVVRSVLQLMCALVVSKVSSCSYLNVSLKTPVNMVRCR